MFASTYKPLQPLKAPPRSHWDDSSFFRRPDVVLVGAGLLGLWTAHALKTLAPKLSITLLEQGTSPTGASTRNAGFACFGSLTEMLADEAKMGTEKMLSILEMRYRGIEKIKATVSLDQIDFEACGGFEQLTPEQAEALADGQAMTRLNHLLADRLGLENVYVAEQRPAASLGLRQDLPIIRNPYEGVLNSGLLVEALTQALQQKGVAFRYGFSLAQWEENGTGVEFASATGQTWSCGHLAFCTNGYMHQLLPQLNTQPARGQIILTQPIPGLALKGSFHAQEGFYYWRHVGNRILLGGARHLAFGDEATTDLSGSDFIRAALEQFLHANVWVPQDLRIERHWSGIMGFSDNKEPLVKAMGSHTSAALACNGMGVALTPVLGETLARQILSAI
ncbi:MAG: FAD-binding oxidoreductase [Sphingobacteriia bacterium]|nr:MAG: FAD-binding oxidoreductase [Sphingobacteriia bacterium]